MRRRARPRSHLDQVLGCCDKDTWSDCISSICVTRSDLEERRTEMTRVAALGLSWVLLAGFPTVVRTDQPRETASPARPKVLIIGTDYAPTCFWSAPGYTNAHLRAVLTTFKPTMLGIESNPAWMARGIVNRVTYEAEVAMDWAAKDHVPVYGVDWAKLEDLAEMNRLGLKRVRETDPRPQSVTQLREEARQVAASLKPFWAELAKHPNDLFLWLNTQGAEQRGRQDVERLSKSTGPEAKYLQDLEYRNTRIVEQILALVRRYPGAKLAVVMGFGHKWPLEQKLAAVTDVELVPWSALPSIGEDELVTAWTPKDSLGTLRESLDGTLFYFNPEGVDMALVSTHLGRLAGAAIDSEEVRYFRARTLVLQKKFGEAGALLRQLGASNTGEGFSYRLTNGWWEFPVAFMARVELAKIADLQGKRELALAGYRAALSDLDKTTPVTPPDESFRDLEAWVTDGHFAFYRAWTCQAARRALQALLQEPFGSVYSSGQGAAADVGLRRQASRQP